MTHALLSEPLLGIPRRFPPRVDAALLERRIRLFADIDGPVLDLASSTARQAVAAAGARGASHAIRAASGGPARAIAPGVGGTGVPIVVSVGALVCFPDLGAALRGIAACLAPGGEAWLVEPVARPGMLATVVASLWSHHPAAAGRHLARDLPAALRAEGFTITDIERFTMPTRIPSLRSFVQLRARQIEGAA